MKRTCAIMLDFTVWLEGREKNVSSQNIFLEMF